MIDSALPMADLHEEAARVLAAAEADHLPLRLLGAGGLAIYLQCPSARSDTRLQRTYRDVDLVTLGRWGGKTRTLFTRLGYIPNQAFNALHGSQRLLFWDRLHERQVDIFLDRLQMCHTLDFRTRLQMDPRTLPLTDLLLSKLQIVEVNEKDLIDTMALFQDHPVQADDEGLNAIYLARLTANDWGLYRTVQNPFPGISHSGSLLCVKLSRRIPNRSPGKHGLWLESGSAGMKCQKSHVSQRGTEPGALLMVRCTLRGGISAEHRWAETQTPSCGRYDGKSSTLLSLF